MSTAPPSILEKMFRTATDWDALGDRRAIFLQCYSMMTENMLVAIREERFHDNAWVERLLHRFADYYFEALACFDCGDAVPLVWREVHEAAAGKELHVLQHLLLGVNAHINYDLVLTLGDMLAPEWDQLSADGRQIRYADHCTVNAIIGETIDAVQDEVIERHAPLMDLIDRLLGRQDERLLLRLIAHWREEVWKNAQELLACPTDHARQAFLDDLEAQVRRKARWLQLDIG